MPDRAINISWPLSSAPGASAAESGGRLINCASEPLGDASANKVVWRRRAGLSKFTDLLLTPFRGGILVDNLAYIAVANNIVTVDINGVVTVAGALPGTDRVTFARDNETPTPSIQCVSPSNGAFAVTSASVNAFNGGGVLPAPNCVCAQDGYFFWGIGDNRIFAAGPNSTAVNALTFITVQSRATGNLLRVVPYQGLLFAFAQNFAEVWADTANPFPGFPYSRYAVIDRGLFGRDAIAGWEDGFGQLLWAADDFGVYMLNGVSPVKVSSPDVDRAIQAVGIANADTLQASCYIESGKSFWALSSPTWTWEFNLNTQKWNERASLKAGQFQNWRAVGSLLAFGKWLTGDNQSTQLLFVDPTTQQEVGTPLTMRMESAAVDSFPNRTHIGRVDFNFITGVGQSAGKTQTAQAPQCSLTISRDSGVTWGPTRLRQLGVEANTYVVYATNWGMSINQGPRWRLDISDEVYAAFMGATMSSDPRAY